MADRGDDVEDAIGVNCVGIVAVDNGRAVVGAGDRQAVEDVQSPVAASSSNAPVRVNVYETTSGSREKIFLPSVILLHGPLSTRSRVLSRRSRHCF